MLLAELRNDIVLYSASITDNNTVPDCVGSDKIQFRQTLLLSFGLANYRPWFAVLYLATHSLWLQ